MTCGLLAVAAVALSVSSQAVSPDAPGPVLVAALVMPFIAFATVGAVVTARRGHVVGWMFLAFAAVSLVGAVGEAWSRYEPGPLPGAIYAAWLQHWTVQSPAVFVFLAFFLLLFPDGRLPSPRWRVPARISVSATALFVFLVAFKPGQLAESTYHNPVAIEALGPVWKLAELPLVAIVMLAVPAAAVAFILRFRRSRGTERLQMKWFALAAVVLGLVIAAAPLIFATESLWWAWPILLVVGTASVPVAAGIAILRHGLYDIDRIIGRTVSYAVVLAVLAGGYAGAVVGLGAVLRPLTGGGDLAVAASTLLVAAAFGPVRRRVRGVVDRRFNRSRYDAARTIDAFTARLRDEIDLTDLENDLHHLVSNTMQPASFSVWIRRTL